MVENERVAIDFTKEGDMSQIIIDDPTSIGDVQACLLYTSPSPRD